MAQHYYEEQLEQLVLNVAHQLIAVYGSKHELRLHKLALRAKLLLAKPIGTHTPMLAADTRVPFFETAAQHVPTVHESVVAPAGREHVPLIHTE